MASPAPVALVAAIVFAMTMVPMVLLSWIPSFQLSGNMTRVPGLVSEMALLTTVAVNQFGAPQTAPRRTIPNMLQPHVSATVITLSWMENRDATPVSRPVGAMKIP